MTRSPYRIPLELEHKLRALRQQGCSYKEVADKLGVGERTVARYAQDVPGRYAGYQPFTDAEIAKARAWRAKGKSYDFIAAKLGRDKGVIRRKLISLNQESES